MMMMVKMAGGRFPCVVLLVCIVFPQAHCFDESRISEKEKPLAELEGGVAHRLHDLFALVMEEADEISSPKKLSEDELEADIEALKEAGWTEVESAEGWPALNKVFLFQDFNEAFGFMSRSALQIEKMNHHPDWCNLYDRVDVTLVTHAAAGISELDVTLANFMEDVASGE